MEDSQPQPTEEALLQRLAQCDLSSILVERWQFLVKRDSVATAMFHLLLERGRMSEAEIAAVLKIGTSVVHERARYLMRRSVIPNEAYATSYQLRQDAVEEYQRLLRSPELIDTTPIHLRLFELLQDRGEMYQEEVAQALKITVAFVKKGVATLEEIGVIEQERKHVSFGKLFYRLRPDATERYQKWLASQQSDGPEA